MNTARSSGRRQRVLALALMPLVAQFAGCANFQAVSDFADQTQKLSAAFDPMLNGAVARCQQNFVDRAAYTSDQPLAKFDAAQLMQDAASDCKPMSDSNAIAHGMAQSLSDYASTLSALASDGVPTSLNDSYDALAAKLGEFPELPPEKVDAASALLKFLSNTVIGHAQREAIRDALGHEEAVGALADALVKYSERVYGAAIKDRQRNQQSLVEALRSSDAAAPASTRLRLLDFQQQALLLDQQHQTVQAFGQTVTQLKLSLHALRNNFDHLTGRQQLAEAKSLAKQVRALYQQLALAF